ncbi:hypothetical protein ACFL0O_08295 [Thermodesulfobacteriota bacterium]
MIHNIRKEYFDQDLSGYRMTFDDGLYSQYYYTPLLKTDGQERIYFIITGLVKPGKARKMFDGEHLAFVKSKRYMYDAFIKGKFDQFMTLEEVQILASQKDVRIGAHSHFHEIIPTRMHPSKKKAPSPWKMERYPYYDEIRDQGLNLRSKLAFQGYNYRDGRLVRRSVAEWEDYIKYDTELSLEWFASNLGLTPKVYCFPFNEHNNRLVGVLKQFGFREFYSARPGENTDIHPRTDIDKLISDVSC